MKFGPPTPLLSGMMLLGCGSSGGAAGGEAPGIPTGFTATAQESAIQLSWDAQPSADTFEIRYNLANDVGTATLLTTSATGTGYLVDNLIVGEKYFFWIFAVNAFGESDFSSSVTARSFVTLTNATSVNLQTPSGSWTFGTIIFAQTTIPSGLAINTSSIIREYDGTGWLNLDLFEYEDAVSLSGAFTVINNTGSAYTFWDTEP